MPSMRPVRRTVQIRSEQLEPISVVVTLDPADASLSIRRKFGRKERRIPIVSLLEPPVQSVAVHQSRQTLQQTHNWPFTDDGNTQPHNPTEAAH